MDTSPEGTAENVADGSHIMWDRLLADSQTDDERRRFENLRAIDAIFDRGRESKASDNTRVPIARTAREDDPSRSESWGKYQLIEEVGSGSYGAVYRARDPELQMDRAIKILHHSVADERTKARLLAEARALASVKDPNIVQVIGVEANDGRVGLCMEFVDGETLESIVSSLGRMSAREALDVAEHVCKALCAVNRAGFVHRDVKARNIMRAEGGAHLLMDFGTGCRIGECGRVEGTPLYMAPEVLAGEPPLESSDVYSVGVLLYYLVTGDYHIDARSLKDVQSAHMLRRYVPLRRQRPDLPNAFVQLVERALAPDLQRRYATPAQMLDSIVRALETRGLSPIARVNYWTATGGLLVSAIAVLTLLGWMCSRYYNATLAKLEFTDETVLNWLSVGIQTSIAPFVTLALVTIVFGLIFEAWTTLRASIPAARDFEARVVDYLRLRQLSTPRAYSTFALAASSLMFLLAWWHSASFIEALMGVGNISTVENLNRVGILSSTLAYHHRSFRAWFTVSVLGWCLLWIPYFIWWLRRQFELHLLSLFAAFAVLLVSTLCLDLPWRLLDNPADDRAPGKDSYREFRTASWTDVDAGVTRECFVMAERDKTALVFCPSLKAPRVFTASTTSEALTLRNGRKDVFSDIPVPTVTSECLFGVMCRSVYAITN